MVRIASFYTTTRRDAVSFWKFLFLSHVQVFSCEISLLSFLKCPYIWFSSHFCFIAFVVLLIFMLAVLILVGIFSLSLMHRRNLQCRRVFFIVLLLYIDVRLRQTCHFKVMHRKEVTHSDGSYEKKSRRRAGWNMGQGKIPWYIHRLIHWKRVACELHDSYFRLMTIKHTIPKIEWAIELLYNLVRTGSQWVGDQMSERQDVIEKATTRQKGPLGPPTEFWRPAGENMLEWEHVPERLSLRAMVEQPWRTRKTTLMAIRVGVNMLQFCSVSNPLSQ